MRFGNFVFKRIDDTLAFYDERYPKDMVGLLRAYEGTWTLYELDPTHYLYSSEVKAINQTIDYLNSLPNKNFWHTIGFGE